MAYTPSAETIAYVHAHSPYDAVIRRSIINGQPWAESRVQVIAMIGDALYYTTDGVWYSVATRSDLLTWEYMPEAPAQDGQIGTQTLDAALSSYSEAPVSARSAAGEFMDAATLADYSASPTYSDRPLQEHASAYPVSYTARYSRKGA